MIIDYLPKAFRKAINKKDFKRLARQELPFDIILHFANELNFNDVFSCTRNQITLEQAGLIIEKISSDDNKIIFIKS
jgi:hypothetical protein